MELKGVAPAASAPDEEAPPSPESPPWRGHDSQRCWWRRRRREAAEAPPPPAASYEQLVAAAEALKKSSGDSAAYASCPMQLMKLGILLLLLASAGIGAGLAYKTGRSEQIHSFHSQFDASADQLHADFQARLNMQVCAASRVHVHSLCDVLTNSQVKAAQMGAKYIAGLPDVGYGLGTFIPGYISFGEDLIAVSNASLATWTTLVTDAERPAFEARAAEAALNIDPTGAHLAEVQRRGIAKRANPNFSGGIRSVVRREQQPLYAVVWAISPWTLARREQYWLFDGLSDPLRRDALLKVINTSQPAMSDLTDFNFADPPGVENPSAIIFAPAWTERNNTYRVGFGSPLLETALGLLPADGAADNITYTRAISVISFHWDTVLAGALPRFIDSIVAVLHSPMGKEFTFSVSGRTVHQVGPGNHHKELCGGQGSMARRLNVTAAGSQWAITLFPTAALRRQYVTSKPRNIALAIAATILATALLFGYYELYDRRRAAHVHARLLTYVHQLEAMQRALTAGYVREAEAKARVLAEEASSAQKDQFVAMVSHEIRTPLNAVGGATALLGGTPLDEEQRELVALLEAGCAHVILIVEDILLHGSLVSGAFSVARERVALARGVLDPAWRMVAMQPAARAKIATLHMSRAEAADVPPVILGDATRLTQVIVNLLSNALKFTPSGGSIQLLVDVVDEAPTAVAAAAKAAEAQSEISAVEDRPSKHPPPRSPDGRWLRFRVRDSGIGVEPAQLERIFEPFVQAEQSTLRRFGGTGLGLTICRRLARAMGGDLVAESARMGHGTTLVFTIPLLLPSDAAADAPPSPPPSPASSDTSSDAPLAPCTPPQPPLQPPPSVENSPPPMSSSAAVPPSPPGNAGALISVLVAEDDPLSQTVMRKVLSRMGVRFTIVANGAHAVEAFMREHFSLVLLDLHMPVLDGLGAVREMCAAMASGEAAATPIYALTASCSDEERARCAEAGMSGLIPKPIKVELLKSLLRKHARPDGEPGPSEPS